MWIIRNGGDRISPLMHHGNIARPSITTIYPVPQLPTAVPEACQLASIELGRLVLKGRTFLRRANSVAKQKFMAATPTLSETFSEYWTRRNNESRYWAEVKRIYDLHVGRVIGMVPLTFVTKGDIKQVIAGLAERPGTQRWAYVFLNAMFRQLVADDELPGVGIPTKVSAAMVGYAELLKEGIYGMLPEKSMPIVTRIQSNGKHLLGLINTVLDISKIEAGQFKLNLTEYLLGSVVETVRAATESLAAKLAFKTDIARDLPRASVTNSA
jgi:hypothetical protein